MAKIKKRKLGWAASTSPQVIGYKFYWAEGEKVTYDSRSQTLGNVTEIVLPDDVDGFDPEGGPIEFGITAMDELGNESDLITLSATNEFNVPQAPEDLWIRAMEEFHAPEMDASEEDASQPIPLFDKQNDQQAADDQATEDQASDDNDPEETSDAPAVVQHYGYQEGE